MCMLAPNRRFLQFYSTAALFFSCFCHVRFYHIIVLVLVLESSAKLLSTSILKKIKATRFLLNTLYSPIEQLFGLEAVWHYELATACTQREHTRYSPICEFRRYKMPTTVIIILHVPANTVYRVWLVDEDILYRHWTIVVSSIVRVCLYYSVVCTSSETRILETWTYRLSSALHACISYKMYQVPTRFRLTAEKNTAKYQIHLLQRDIPFRNYSAAVTLDLYYVYGETCSSFPM